MSRPRVPRLICAALALVLTVPAATAAARAHDRQPPGPRLHSDAASASTRPTTEPNPAGAAVSMTPSVSVGRDGSPAAVDLGLSGACDDLDPKACLLPFPNDRFTVPDPSTDTGRRVQLALTSMPVNVAGVPVDPTEWNRQDGFSPISPVLTYVPGLDLHRTFGTTVDQIADLARYQAPSTPIVLLDATTGLRHPFWSELDQHPGTPDAERLLILRPATELLQGHRYVVALRNLRDHHDDRIGANAAFRAYRDKTIAPPGAGREFEARRPHLEQLFSELGAAGIDRGDLFLAWDFTVASTRNLTERVLHIRDDAFAQLGDTNLADRTITGSAPHFTVTDVHEFATGPSLRRVQGTVQVPNYLTPQVEVSTRFPAPVGDVGATLDGVYKQLPPEVLNAVKPVTGAVPVGVSDVLTNSLSVPLSRFNTLGSPDGLPAVDPLQPTLDVPFTCEIARTSLREPSHPALYGHGLLGSQKEVTGGSTARLRERNVSPCAVDWYGFSFADLPNVAVTLTNLSNMASAIDRTQQGMLDFLYLGRVLSHPQGFVTHPAFQGARGRPLVRTGELAFTANSQGSIIGGALTAIAPDFERSFLGVPGMGYSTLLNRSLDWEGKYGEIYYAAYPDPIDRQLGYVLLQMLWDRGETAGYAQHITRDPLPNTPTHDAFLQVAFGDHQVTNVAAEVEGRTIGAAFRTPSLAAGRHWATDPAFGFRTVHGDTPDVGSVLVYWYWRGAGLKTPPNGNLPQGAGKDPHSAPRSYGPATDQVVRWLLTGDFVDVCGNDPCEVP
jgi:hypothetical protein